MGCDCDHYILALALASREKVMLLVSTLIE